MKNTILFVSLTIILGITVSMFLTNMIKSDGRDSEMETAAVSNTEITTQHTNVIDNYPSQDTQKPKLLCEDVALKSKDLEASVKQRDYLISKGIRAANELNAPIEVKEYVAQKMAVPILSFRDTISYGPENYSSLPELDPDIKKDKLKGDDFTRFLRLMQSADYDQIVVMADQRPFNQGTTFGGRPIISALLYHDSRVPVQVIVDLTKMGIVPSIFDLQTATQKKSPMATIVALRAYTDSDVTKYWSERNTQSSLAMGAANSMYAEAFAYWLGQSSPAQFEELDINAADLIATSINDVSTDIADSLLQTLFAESLVPYDKTNRDLLVRYISSKSLEHLTDYLNLLLTHKLSIDDLALPAEMELSLQETATEIALLNSIIAEKENYIKTCSEKAVTASLTDNPQPTSDIDEANLALALEIDVLAKQQNWSGYIDKWKTLSNQSGNNDMMQFAIGELIRHHAPHEYVIQLIAQGYEMPEVTIFAIILADDAILANKLLKYDLQVNNVSLEDMNPREFATMVGASEIIMQFLDNHSN